VLVPLLELFTFFGCLSQLNSYMFMLEELPFSNLSTHDFAAEFDTTLINNCSKNRLNDHGLKDMLFNITKNEIFKKFDSGYYTCEHFNDKTQKLQSNIELSIFHINIGCLNSKQSGCCQLIDLINLEFDVLVVSEVWTYNIDFLSCIFDGYCFFVDLPKINKNWGVRHIFMSKSQLLANYDLTCN